SLLFVEATEAETRRRKASVAVHGLLIGRDRLAELRLSLVEQAEVVRGEEMVLVELHRRLVLLARLLREAPRGEKVAEVVAKVSRVRILRDTLLLREDLVVQGIPGDEVLSIERLVRLLVACQRNSRREQESGADHLLHVRVSIPVSVSFGLAISRTWPSRSAITNSMLTTPKCPLSFSLSRASLVTNRSRSRPETSS